MKARFLVAALVLGAVSLPAKADAIKAPLQPGKVLGSVHVVERPGLNRQLVASYFGVIDSKVQPQGNGKFRVDQRRIEPQFYPWVNGIVLNIPEAHVYLVDGGTIVKDYPAGVSMRSWPAPLGQFKVVEMRKNPTWYVPVSIQEEMKMKGEEVKTEVPPGPDNPLGTRWIGFADGSYGFHGTPSPWSIKDYRSHGCIRMFEKDVQDLYGRVKLETPVRVYYQPVKLAVDGDKIWLASYPDIYDRYHKQLNPGAMVRDLAQQAGVLDRIDWDKVGQKLRDQDGILTDVARKS